MTEPRLAIDGHLTPETLAELDEGLLDAATALSAQGHLVGCPRCTAVRDELRAVPGRLADARDAGPAPADVVARLDAALAAQRAGTAPTATITPLATGRRPPRGLRLLQAAAAVVVLLAGAGIAVTAIQGGDEEGSAADSAATAERPASAQGSFPVTSSGRNWSEDSVTEAVPRLVAGSLAPTLRADASKDPQEGGGDAGGAAARELAEREVARLAGGPPLAECVTALNDGPVTPLAVDLATWKGQPAAVIVLPTLDDPATVDTWVVGPDCSQADAKVLYFARVARP